MLRQPTLRDFLIGIGVSGFFAVAYFMALAAPNRNRLTRWVNGWTEFWAEFPLSAPKRAGIWIVAVVCTLIAVGGAVGVVLDLVAGRIP